MYVYSGLTNIAFLKPCSIVIEIFTWGYRPIEYYQSLASDTSLLYFEYQSQYNQTIFKSTYNYEMCLKIIQNIMKIVKFHNIGNRKYNRNQLEIINKACYLSDNCRLCMQSDFVDSIYISEVELHGLIENAIIERKRCIIFFIIRPK